MAKTILVNWTVRYLSPEGYEITITLSGDDLKDVMVEGKELIQKMRKGGLVPLRNGPRLPRPHRTAHHKPGDLSNGQGRLEN